MQDHLREFDELFVVSDLHMGGRATGGDSFQIFNRGPRLGALIRHISAERAPEQEVALVLNGDIFDSLAEDEIDGYIALDSRAALKMMKHLYRDSAFKPVWDSLKGLVQQEKRHLVFVVGNHDIEMALPVVENSIRQHLGGQNGEIQSRIHFATHGGGFACRVGRARVFCTHGNELDDFNLVDYNLLGQLANAMNAGRAADASKWKPNAGTRLVVDVMNVVKHRYPFVDLLKPEAAAVASVLMVLDKDTFEKVDFEAAFPILRDKVRGNLVTSRLLSANSIALSGVSADVIAEEVANELLGPSLRQAVQEIRGISEDDLLLEVETAAAEGKTPEDLASEAGLEGTLGGWDLFKGWVGLIPKEEGLRRGLQDWLKDDSTFDVEFEDDLFNRMEERIGDSVDFVVTGHTHKPRALTFDGGAHYYNSGTWIRTLRLTDEALDDPVVFKNELWTLFQSGRMADLDKAEIPGPNGKPVPLVLDRTNAVRISAHGTSIVGELLSVTDGKKKGTVTLSRENGTRATKVNR